MEDIIKVNAKLAQLLVQNGEAWLPVYNTNHLIDTKDRKVTDLKTFICRRTGEVVDFPIADFMQ